VLADAACAHSVRVQGIKYPIYLDNEATGLLSAENELGSVNWETMSTEKNNWQRSKRENIQTAGGFSGSMVMEGQTRVTAAPYTAHSNRSKRYLLVAAGQATRIASFQSEIGSEQPIDLGFPLADTKAWSTPQIQNARVASILIPQRRGRGDLGSQIIKAYQIG